MLRGMMCGGERKEGGGWTVVGLGWVELDKGGFNGRVGLQGGGQFGNFSSRRRKGARWMGYQDHMHLRTSVLLSPFVMACEITN